MALVLEYLAVIVILGLFSHADSQRVVEPKTKEYEECLQIMAYETPPTNESEPMVLDIKNVEVQAACIQEILWKNERVKWSDFNVTDSDRKLVAELAHSLVSNHHRSRRAASPGKFPRIFPKTGFRIRREYRRMADWERYAYHAAVNAIKLNGRYEALANIHSAAIEDVAHNGPNFFGWHRVYLALYEEALRKVNWWVSLPYWDSSLDFHMENPLDSIIWSEQFLGNGDGIVVTGPFANWPTPFDALERDNILGNTIGRLISKEVIADILSRCRTEEISVPTALAQYNLEWAHNGVHVWVNGHMWGVGSAPHDPVFWMHHAFIDYLWELFRMRQASPACNRNPETDYPPGVPQQGPNEPMVGFPQYRNIDGYRNYWTRFWYQYERSPTCSPAWPSCGTPYLRCDFANSRCISQARMFAPGSGSGAAAGAFGARGFVPLGPAQVTSRAESRAARFGRLFRGPPPDRRSAFAGFRGK